MQQLHASTLVPVANNAEYLVELAHELPLSASQFGLVLTTMIDLTENPGQARCENTTPGYKQPHFRSMPMSLPDLTDEGQVQTIIDVTISGHAATFYARCESLQMQAAVLEADAGGEASQDRAKDHRATAELFSKVLDKGSASSVIHFQRVQILAADILQQRAATRSQGPGEDAPSPDMFYCINDIWKPALASLATLTDGNKAVKFAITETELLSAEPEIRARCQQLEEHEALVFGPMLESDVKLMIKSNGVKYSELYGQHIIKRSVCFRNQTVARAGTHEDFSIAALHVLPAYRKMGLGKLVLQSLALMHVRLARKALAGGADSRGGQQLELFAHADCLEHNIPTMVFMERCGWHRVGHYIWLGLLPTKEMKQK